MQINIDKILERVEQGYVSVRPHPKDSLRIFNYTTATQIEAKWDEATMVCRGLILDHRNNVVARPFPKFFNVGEVPVIRNRTSHLYGKSWKDFYSLLHTQPFRAYPKMDGSLGVVFYNPLAEGWEIATRGSFESEQAKKGQELLNQLDTGELEPRLTFLVEIIYPENRIVLDYKGHEGLHLLAVINTATGEDSWDEFKYASGVFDGAVQPLEGTEYLSQLEALDQPDNEEGYVLVYPTLDNFRMKFKFDEYCRLHKIMTGVTPRRVWDQLRNNQDLDLWLDKVPDEFYTYVRSIASSIETKYTIIECDAKYTYHEVKGLPNRKRQAERLKDYGYRGIVFSMLDGRDYSDSIWRLVEPRGAFINE